MTISLWILRGCRALLVVQAKVFTVTVRYLIVKKNLVIFGILIDTDIIFIIFKREAFLFIIIK